MTERIAFYPGSFDPVTLGHLDVLRHAFAVADRLVVGVGVHPGKVPLFSFDERRTMIETALAAIGFGDKATVVAFDNLVINAVADHGASLLIRGLRDGTDLDYEMQMAGMNQDLDAAITTVFLPASPATRHITATLVRQIAKLGGDVSAFVPDNVRDAMALKRAG